MATVFRELVRASADVRMDWLMVNDRLAGSYGHAASLLQDTVLLGVLAAEGGQLALNPPDHVMLSPGDRLVALTRQGEHTPSSAAAALRHNNAIAVSLCQAHCTCAAAVLHLPPPCSDAVCSLHAWAQCKAMLTLHFCGSALLLASPASPHRLPELCPVSTTA